MSANTIERLSVNYLKIRLMATEYLDPYINEGDKEPSWDGNVYILEDPQKNTKNKLGKVPVQVKGKSVSSIFSSNTITYPVEVIDLNNYLEDGGILYFVVYLLKDDHTIYYAQLEPIKIKEILINIDKEQKTKSITLKKLPDNNLDIVNIFKSFLYNRKKQLSFISEELYTLDKLSDLSEGTKLTFSLSGLGLNRQGLQKYIDLNNVYMYAEIPGLPVSIPIVGNITSLTERINVPSLISNNGKDFYTNVFIEEHKGLMKIIIGKSFNIFVNETDKANRKYTINYDLTSSFRNAIVDLEFLILLYEKNGFYLNDEFIDVSLSKETVEKFNLEECKEVLKMYRKLEDLLYYLNIKDDLDMNKFSPEDETTINVLIDGLIDREELKLNEEFDLIGMLRFQGLNIPLIFDKQKNGKYIIEELFNYKKPTRLVMKDLENKNELMVPMFRILDHIQLSQCSTLRLDRLLPDYKLYHSKENNLLSDANHFALILIKASDYCDDLECRKEELLDVGLDFYQWIQEKNQTEENAEILELNRLQILKRKNDLSEADINFLYQLTNSEKYNATLKFGAHVLLEEYVRAERVYEKLDKNIKKEYENYPIYNLYIANKP